MSKIVSDTVQEVTYTVITPTRDAGPGPCSQRQSSLIQPSPIQSSPVLAPPALPRSPSWALSLHTCIFRGKGGGGGLQPFQPPHPSTPSTSWATPRPNTPPHLRHPAPVQTRRRRPGSVEVLTMSAMTASPGPRLHQASLHQPGHLQPSRRRSRHRTRGEGHLHLIYTS
jgi:hypothetical protein